MVYKVRSGESQRTFKHPHPYADEAIHQLVYNEVRPVTSSGIAPKRSQSGGTQRSPTGLQMQAIVSIIRRELGKFMGQYKLTRYLASYGTLEYENARAREEEIGKLGHSVADTNDPVEIRQVSPPPEFEARPKITSLFTEFTNQFSKSVKDGSVELHWIGVGTWKPPVDIVPEQHLDAWRLSLDNLFRGSKIAIDSLGQDVKIKEKIRLIQDVPLARFQADKISGKDYKYIAQNLLVAYREQLVKIENLLKESQLNIPDEIPWAIWFLEDILGIKHGPWVRGSVPPPSKPKPQKSSSGAATGPSSPLPSDEKEAYEYLVQITGHDRDRADRLIELERSKDPRANRMMLIQRAIERFWQDNR